MLLGKVRRLSLTGSKILSKEYNIVTYKIKKRKEQVLNDKRHII